MRPVLLSSLSIFACFALIWALRATSSATPPLAPHIRPSGIPLFAVTVNNRTGYIDSSGTLVLPAIYSCGGEFSEGLAPVRLKGRYGYIDQMGNWVIQPQYDWASSFSDGMALVNQQGKPHYIDYIGQAPFPCDYTSLYSFQHSIAIVRSPSGKYGLIDRNGRSILGMLYDRINDFYSGIAVVERSGRSGLVDTAGQFIVPLGTYEDIKYFNGDYGEVNINDHSWGIVDRSGKLIFSSSKEDPVCLPFSNGRSFIRHETPEWTYTLINTRMQPVGNTLFTWVDQKGFVNGHAFVQTETGYGIIDTNGHFAAVPGIYPLDHAGFIGDYLFAGKLINGKQLYSVITNEGRPICKTVLQDFDASGFQNGLLKVIINDRLAFINTHGAIVWQTPQNEPLQKFNIDYLMRGYFLAYSSPKKNPEDNRGGGWYIDKNIPKKGAPHNTPPASLSLTIDTAATDTFARHYQGYAVYITNTTTDTACFNASDSRLYMQVEALNEEGVWKFIDYLPSSWCGNSYHTLELEPNAYWKFTLPRFEGEIPTKLRIQVRYKDKDHPRNNKTLFSNTITASINPGQFCNKHQYSPRNIMDPYND